MIDVQRLETVLEHLNNEISELPDSATKSNLEGTYDALYDIFEDVLVGEDDVETLKEENRVMRNLLTAYLSPEDKQYIRIKYDLEL